MGALDKLIEAVEAGLDTAHHHAAAFPSESAYGLCTWHRTHKAARGDLNAGFALLKELLPNHWLGGFRGNCGSDGGNFVAEVHHLRGRDVHRSDGIASTPARAWLLAILRAYRAQQEGQT